MSYQRFHLDFDINLHADSKRCSSVGHRTILSPLSRLPDLRLQFTLVYWCHHVRRFFNGPLFLVELEHSAAWTTYGTFKINSAWAWRIPSALQGVPSVLQFALVFFCPESPRFLVSKGREEEALDTLAYYHADGNR